MKFCAVQGCYSNDTYDDIVKRRFFMCPKDQRRADSWQNFTCDLKRKYTNTPKKLFICDRHFVQSDYNSGGRLKETAIPTRNGPTSEVVQLAENPIHKRRGRMTKNASGFLKTAREIVKKRKKSKAKLKSCLSPASLEKATALRTILPKEVRPINRVLKLIQLDTGSEPNSQMGDHNYTAAKRASNNDNVLVLTPVTEPPDFIKKKVEELKKSRMIGPNATPPNLSNYIKYARNPAIKTVAGNKIMGLRSESTNLPIAKNVNNGITDTSSDLTELIPSKIFSGLMHPIDVEPLTVSEEVTTMTHLLKENYEEEHAVQGLFEENYEEKHEVQEPFEENYEEKHAVQEPFEENYEEEHRTVQKPNHQVSQRQDENYSILFKNCSKFSWTSLQKQNLHAGENVVLDSKHQELRKQDSNDSLLVKFNTYLREQIDKYLEQQKITEENLSRINKDVEIMSDASDDSVVYLVVGDECTEGDNQDNYGIANYSDDSASHLTPKEISGATLIETAIPSRNGPTPEVIQLTSHNNTTKELKTTSSTYKIGHNGSKNIGNRRNDSETSSVKSNEGTSSEAEITVVRNGLVGDNNGVMLLDLEPSLNSSLEERAQLSQCGSEKEVNKGLETSSGYASAKYCSRRKCDKSRSLLKKILVQNKTSVAPHGTSNEEETEKITSNGVNIINLSSFDKSKYSSREIIEEQLNKVALDSNLSTIPVGMSSPIEGVVDDTMSADENFNELPTADKNLNRKTWVMREHLKRVKELSRKKIIRKYQAPKFPNRRKLLRSKCSITAYAESLGTFNCHPPERVKPVDLERVPEWHKLYTPGAVSKSFPRLNEACISNMVNQLKGRLPSLEPRDQLEVSFLLSVMSAYPGAPEYVKELLTQRLNVVYIGTLFHWDTALALAARGHSEFGPITDQTVPSVPLTKLVSRKRGIKNPRPNPKYYSSKWNTDKIVVPVEAVKPHTFAFEVIIPGEYYNQTSR